MTSIVPSVAVVCLLSVPAPIVAQQTPASAPPVENVENVEKGSATATSGTPAPAAAAAPAPQPAPPYSYDPQGRRDPFVSLVARGSDPGSAANRPAGLPGLLIAEVAVKGIVRDRSGLIA